jgi:hypothetical protein
MHVRSGPTKKVNCGERRRLQDKQSACQHNKKKVYNIFSVPFHIASVQHDEVALLKGAGLWRWFVRIGKVFCVGRCEEDIKILFLVLNWT